MTRNRRHAAGMGVRTAACLLLWVASGCSGSSGFAQHRPRQEAPTQDAGQYAATERCVAAAQQGSATVGEGDLVQPAIGPGPLLATRLKGACMVLIKNWDFGADGTVSNTRDLIREFEFHDQFNTIANGDKYGSVIVAPDAASAIYVNGLGLPGNKQPVEDPRRPTREWTRDSLKAHVRPLSAVKTHVSASAHDVGCGSFMAKWRLAHGGALLGHDLLWETRVRMPVPRAGFWFALWTAGNKWNKGAEMDVVEAFGAPHLYPPADKFHVASAGGKDDVDYHNWPRGLARVGVPAQARDLTQWHTFSWLYRKDDTYEVYLDTRLVQSGTLHWTRKGELGGEPIDMRFLFDFAWGHTKIAVLDVTMEAREFPLTYEIDYSRVYLSEK